MIRRWLDRWAARRCIRRLHEACGTEKNDADLAIEATLWALAGEPRAALVCLRAAGWVPER